jgi:hypothetical protein
MQSDGNDSRLPLTRLQIVAARYVLDAADGMALVQTADTLLDAGFYSWHLGELATTPLRNLRDVGSLFESALKELNISLPSPEEAAPTLVRWHLGGLIEGRDSPEQALGCLCGELRDLLTWDRRLQSFQSERDLLYLWYRYDVLALTEEGFVSRADAEREVADLDIQVLERARSWMGQQGHRLLDPCWLTWNSGIVRKLAQAIAEEHAWDRLPILADALEEAGCINAELIEHCRAGEKHARCCWIIDLLLLENSAGSR